MKSEGLPGKTPELKIPAGSNSGTFVIPSEMSSQLPENPVKWDFRLTGEVAFQHKPGPAAVLYARAEQTRLKNQEREYEEQIESSRATSVTGTGDDSKAVQAAVRLPAVRSAIRATADRLKLIAERTRASSRKIRAYSKLLSITCLLYTSPSPRD